MIRLLFLMTALVGLFNISSAQTSNYISYGLEDGLPQSQVRAIQQDSEGHLWIGTMAGVSSFDGFGFDNLSKENGLSANRVNCIFQGSKLFIGSTGAVNYFEGKTLRRIDLGEALEEVRILDIAEAENGELYFATGGKGVVKWSLEGVSFYNVESGLPDDYVRSVAFDKNGSLWIGTRNGLVFLDPDQNVITSPDSEVPLISVSQIRISASGQMIVSTFGNGVLIFKDNGFLNLTEDEGLISNSVRCAVELANGDFWFGSKRGVSRFHNGKLESFDENNGLPYSNIKSIGKDLEGNLWLGTDGQGLLRRTGDLFQTYTTEDGLSSNLIMSIAKKSDGDFIMGTYDSGISIFQPQGAKVYEFNDELPSTTVWTVQEIEGTVVAGTSKGLFSEKEGDIKRINYEDGLPGNRVTSLLTAKNKDLIAGTDSGLAWISSEFKVEKTMKALNGELLTGVRSILAGSDGIFCGTNAGLLKVDSKGNALLSQLPNESQIYAMAIDSLENIWVGSADGLFHYNLEKDLFSLIQFSNSFGSKNINFLVIEEGNRLFIGTNDGLFNLDIDAYYESHQIRVIQYTKFEGLSSSETNQGAAFSDGTKLWFGTTSGAIEFNTALESTANQQPFLEISDVQLFLGEVDWKTQGDSVSTETGLPVELELKHNQNYITFDYDGIYFKNPEKVRYQYQLEGVDEEWLPPTKNRSATYSYLPDGSYTFKVRSYQIDNPSGISTESFDFTILPPFYKTAWFYFLIFVSLLGILYLIYSSRIKKEREKREKIQLQLQTKLIELESQSLNSSMNRHFIFNALNSIQYYINTQDRKSANKYLTSFAKLIRKNLDSSQQMDTSLGEEIERLELYLSLEQMRFQQKFDYEFLIDKGIDVDALNIPAMMLQPFLENSIWHGILPNDKHGEIKIHVQVSAEFYEIVIDDNGVGIDTSMSTKSTNREAHVSKGMDLTVNRVRLYQNMTGLNYEVKGPFERKSATGNTKGTRVMIRIPKKSTVNESKQDKSWKIERVSLP
ncbi:MAG: two-component regulator propeller domain-containing protein [Bacteroidota bacterium]